MWFGTRKGVSRYDGERFVTLTTQDGLMSDGVRCMLEDREGHMWFGTRKGVSRYDGAFRSDGIELATFTVEDGLADNQVFCLLEDREGHLWFGTRGGDVSRYDGTAFVTFTTEDGLLGHAVLAIAEDREGSLWFGTRGGGVSRYDGEAFTTLTVRDGLADNTVSAIGEDREGNLWFGTGFSTIAGAGICRYAGKQFATFTAADGLVSEGVHCIMEDQEGSLWFGTWDGVSRYQGGRFTTLEGLAANVWVIVEDRKGHMWFGTWKGVSRYDGTKLATFTTADGLANNGVLSILEDREGHLWLGTWNGGVSRYDGETFTALSTEDGLAHHRVWAILEDRKGHLWFGTGDGVSQYDAHRPDGERFVTFTTEDGLVGGWVTSILEDREGNLWFGSVNGVSCYDGTQFVAFTTEDGLIGNRVTSILEDREGHLWFSTYGSGVSRYDGRVFQHLHRRNGLVHNGIQGIFQDHRGDFWIATDGGVTRYRSRRTPPGIRIRDVVADRHYDPTVEMRVPVSQKFIAFKFQGGSFTTPQDEMAYVVRLEGYDPDWKPNYTGRVEYQDLPLGDYTFQVKAVDRDLNYSEAACMRVIVEPDPHLEAFADALKGTSEEFVGESAAVRRVQMQLSEVAPTDLTVLILGETGTGKGLAARTVHELSPRKRGPFIQVHCGAIPEALVESELFGHEKGAFTGAVSRKLGKVELAKGDTLFLDEIGDMPLEAQVKLLHLLEERTFQRVGGTQTLSVDARILAATNRDLLHMIGEGLFREDLYFRLQEFVVELPPLRERGEDIPLLASYFTARVAAHLDKEVTRLTREALSVMQRYDWPGNVRELEHVVRRAVIVCPGPTIRKEDIPLESGSVLGMRLEDRLTPEEYERQYLREVLEQTGWVISGSHGAASMLGLPESTLRYRMKKLGIVRA